MEKRPAISKRVVRESLAVRQHLGKDTKTEREGAMNVSEEETFHAEVTASKGPEAEVVPGMSSE